MRTLQVELGNRSYPIYVQRGILNNIAEYLDEWNQGQKWVLITQPFLREAYGQSLVEALSSSGYQVNTIEIPAGEKAKTIAQVESIYQKLLDLQCDRGSTLVALGGGVVGDVTGFVAATFMRGIDYVQIPTTLLAMVDSSIGGKTGVNLPQGKNLIGSIYQPRAVVVDPDVLKSLPQREVISGFGEVLKYGAIRDARFFKELAQNLDQTIALKDKVHVDEFIARSCEIKANIVSQDEREGDLRRILNFGHTIGHALETSSGYGVIRHGEAVAFGMICAGEISKEMGLLDSRDNELLQSTIRSLPLPSLNDLDPDRILNLIRHDKKVRSGQLHYIVLEGLGNARVSHRVSNDLIRQGLAVL